MPSFSPDELKAITLHYGSYRIAAKKLGIKSPSTLIEAATADYTGTGRRLSPEISDRIYRHTRRLGKTAKANIRQWERMFESIEGHPNIKRVFMNGSQTEREWAKNNFKRYSSRLKEETLWSKIMSKFYDRHGWQRGKFSR